MSIRKGAGHLILEDSIRPDRIVDPFTAIIIQGIHKLIVFTVILGFECETAKLSLTSVGILLPNFYVSKLFAILMGPYMGNIKGTLWQDFDSKLTRYRIVLI